MKKLAYKNIIISVLFRIACLIVAVPSIRILISTLGSEANGINSLFISIVGILSVSELGIGTAITFCMYKPIIDKDDNQVNALYLLFNKIYKIVGLIYLTIGLCISPFIYLLASDVSGKYNITILFILYLVPSSLSYLYQSKIALLNAHKENYMSVIITQSCLLLKFTLQILTLYYFESFEVFYISYLISELICLFTTNIIVNKKYKYLIKGENKVEEEVKKDIIIRIKALFCHKIGGLLVNTTDNIIISAVISVNVLGMYSNYVLIMTSITSILVLLVTPLTSMIGHSFVDSKEKTYKYFNFLYYLNFVISFIVLLGYFAVVDEVVVILFGVSQELGTSISFILAVTHFITMMRKPVLVVRDAAGMYTKDKFKPIIECCINLILSLILVKYFGVVGVLISTIITSIFICHIVEPYVLHKHGFNKKSKTYLVRNYVYITAFVVNLIIVYYFKDSYVWIFPTFVINGTIAVLLSCVTLSIIFFIDKPARNSVVDIFKNRKDL